jgi:hypothetical protein
MSIEMYTKIFIIDMTINVEINLPGLDFEFFINNKWAIEFMNKKRITRKNN